MSLKVKKSFKNYLPKIILGIFILLFAAFVIKVATWENNYYKEKEGSERIAPGVVGDVEDKETSTEEITEQQKVEYKVAADKPRYLYIDKLGISKARIMEVGVNSKGQMQTPYSIYDAAWYNKSDKPGKGGTSVFNGHNGGPGVNGIFKNLKNLTAGDIITIEMGDGKTYDYRVYDNFEVKLSEANEKMSLLFTSPVDGTESISIISCVGDWSLKQKTYLSRQFLRATRV